MVQRWHRWSEPTRTVALIVLTLGVGVASEHAAGLMDDPAVMLPDPAVGLALVLVGALLRRCDANRAGWTMILAGLVSSTAHTPS